MFQFSIEDVQDEELLQRLEPGDPLLAHVCVHGTHKLSGLSCNALCNNAALNAFTYPCELYLLTVGLRYPSWAYRGALLAQAAYDAFWLKRLVTSVRRYRLAARKAAMAA